MKPVVKYAKDISKDIAIENVFYVIYKKKTTFFGSTYPSLHKGYGTWCVLYNYYLLLILIIFIAIIAITIIGIKIKNS